ncbi:hypothetical protein GCWU000342_00935 [Shuttleworthella satelles DSM 14600]|uniref:Uncharacterized protein n=1 Tax=Shuttleworthella satelles DSM 14600 TaxID=626523 RepID=C4GAI5_9FIRM|nr:hypothetical protein GCWU000342_00935 [Shuttleworthia satelles DSM 14600]
MLYLIYTRTISVLQRIIGVTGRIRQRPGRIKAIKNGTEGGLKARHG